MISPKEKRLEKTKFDLATRQKIAISFSGGRTSAYMAYLIKTYWGDDHDLSFVFANTGKENEETLKFVDDCDRAFGLNVTWVEASVTLIKGVGTTFKIVDFNTAARNGEPFEKVIQKFGIPNVNSPKCSDELKMEPIQKFNREFFGTTKYFTAIGIRMDEFDRMSDRRKERRLIYPLISEWPTRKQDVLAFFSKLDFDLQLKDYQGNCDFCYKKSLAKRIKIAQENPEKLEWWNEIETKYGHVRALEGEVRVFGRDRVSIQDILNMAKTQPDHRLQLTLFEDLGSCGSETCEAF